MEQPQGTPSVQSPKIQFREPSFSYSGGPVGVGVDGRRLSMADATNEVFIDDDPAEDWTRTTAERDSWAHRERRRSSMWHKIESYPSSKPVVVASSPTRSTERVRRGSILSLFKHGKDKDGRDVLHSGEGDDWHNASSAAVVASSGEVDEPSSPKDDMPRDRRGSILSMWTWGKDKSGRDVIHSGLDDDSD